MAKQNFTCFSVQFRFSSRKLTEKYKTPEVRGVLRVPQLR